jgi:hypothetical protein
MHYSRFRKAVDQLKYKGIETTADYRKFCDDLDKKSETGLQANLLAGMIPIEIAGFLAAMVGAICELL